MEKSQIMKNGNFSAFWYLKKVCPDFEIEPTNVVLLCCQLTQVKLCIPLEKHMWMFSTWDQITHFPCWLCEKELVLYLVEIDSWSQTGQGKFARFESYRIPAIISRSYKPNS